MVDTLVPKDAVKERPTSEWQTIAVELLGASIEMVSGERGHYRVIHKGDGPPVFMYHGIGGHAESYARNISGIAAAGYHVYLVDQLFHGYSSKEGFPVESPGRMIDMEAEGFVDLLDKLGHEKAIYIGESMSAWAGFHIGMRYPERIEKMVLNGFGPLKLDRTFEESRKGGSLPNDVLHEAVKHPNYDSVAERLHGLVHPDHPHRVTDEMVRVRLHLYQDPEINQSMRRVFNVDGGGHQTTLEHNYSEADARKEWRPETLVIWSEYNPGTSPEYGAYIAEILHAKYYVIDDAGKWPQWEKPDEYNAIVIQFLKG